MAELLRCGEQFEGRVCGLVYRAAFETTVNPRGGRWRRHVLANAAPRDRMYMEALFQRKFPNGYVAEISGDAIPCIDWSGVTAVVLLYPDAIGLGFGRLERWLKRALPTGLLCALNGRGRLLKLDSIAARSLRARRFLEWTRIPEFVFFAAMVITTPFLIISDVLRGRF